MGKMAMEKQLDDLEVSIVASTGGLVDTVKEGYTGFQMGVFNVECETVDPADLITIAMTVKRALAVYGTPAFSKMIQNYTGQELSWKVSITSYENENYMYKSKQINNVM
ncbi:putative NDP-glucose--starch glucosyltransferase [Helianthus anomalus]